MANNALALRMFQSTYLYKVRPGRLTYQAVQYSFNPRTYIRYDEDFSTEAEREIEVSIHVPI